MTTTRETTKVFLNTWGAYNEGSIGYRWMTPEEAKAFIERNPNLHGGEWFIADIDNYLGVELGNLEYANPLEICDTLSALEELDEYDLNDIVALMEYLNIDDVQEALDRKDHYCFYLDLDDYHEVLDQNLDFRGNDLLERYFDYDAFHRDCDFDVYVASNGVVIGE